MSNIKQVIVMRKDLNMRKGKMIAQGAHASMKVFFDLAGPIYEGKMVMYLTDEMKEWVNGLFTKITLSCDSEEELDKLYKKAIRMGLPCSMIEDSGLTEFHGNPTKTCIAIGPAKAEKIDKITGDLKLL